MNMDFLVGMIGFAVLVIVSAVVGTRVENWLKEKNQTKV